MTREEGYACVPLADKIVSKGVTRINSVFDFDNAEDLFSFLHVCEVKKSTVEFINEGLVYLNGRGVSNTVPLVSYMLVKENPKIVEDYIRWLLSKSAS